jgi:protein TonB
MTHKEILTSNLLDIIFENRNKQYGAYVLRKNYNQRLGLSLFIALSTTFILFFIFRNQHYNGQLQKNLFPEILIKNYTAHIEIPVNHITSIKQKTLPQVRQRIWTNFKIVENPHNPPTDLREFDKAIPSIVNSDGVIPTTTSVTSPPASNGNGNKQPEEKPFEPIERAPEFRVE